LDIAQGGQGVPLTSEVQVQAIKALQESPDPEIAVKLSSLLQPHYGLDVRAATAQSLQRLPCKGECILGILHYLERVSRGEVNYEDAFIPARTNPVISPKKQQQDFYESLCVVLRRETSDTTATLRNVYGVGSPMPSRFALDLLSRLGLREACPLLLESDKQIKIRPADLFDAPRQELTTTLASLHCK
jgi:hypothetical protein